MPVLIASRNILTDTLSADIGICRKALPAKTTNATLSLRSLEHREPTTCLALDRRVGSTSAAIIELDTSIATTTSMPISESVFIRIPI